MGKSIYTICLDLQKVDSQETIYAKQGDTDRLINFTLRDGGKPFVLKETDVVVLSTITPEGNTIEESVNTKSGIAIYEFSRELTASIGAMNVELRIYSEGKNVITASFTLVVEARNGVAKDVTAQASFEALDEVYARANEAIEGAQNATLAANDARDEAKKAAKDAIEATQEAYDAADRADRASADAVQSSDEAKKAAGRIEGAIEESEAATSLAQLAEARANEAAGIAEEKAYLASDAAQLANIEAQGAIEAAQTAYDAAERANDAIDRLENEGLDIDKSLFANAITDSKSGEIVVLTDVSPFEHILGVKAKSKNLLKPSISTKWLCNGSVADDGFITLTATATSGSAYAVIGRVTLKKGVTYGCNFINATNMGSFYFWLPNTTTSKWDGAGAKVYTPTEDITLDLAVYMKDITLETASGYVQLEESSTIPTTHTPYIADVSTANVLKYGGNLLDIEGREVVNFGANPNTTKRTFTGKGIIKGIAYNNYYGPSHVLAFEKHKNGFSFTNRENQSAYGIGFDFKAMPNMTFVVYYKGMEKLSGSLVFLGEYDKDGNYLRTPSTESTTNGTRYFTTGENTAWVVINFQNTLTQLSGDFNNVYIGVDTFTGFEEYQEPVIYPVAADGTVEGITSLYPTTTLITDTEGVVLDVDYIVDTKKYIDKIKAELQALILGG